MDWGLRVCAGCGYDLSMGDFSRNQWMKGVGYSRCTECVSENVRCNEDSFGAARRNNATKVEVNLHGFPDEEGTAKLCYYGFYRGGQRTGQRLVAKCYKDGDTDFSQELNAIEKTQKIIGQWNQLFGDNMLKLRINIPEEWNVGGTDCLIEPFIEGFTKFNSNTGWTINNISQTVMKLQALSHFSYHISSGQFLLCDLQGGIYRDFIVLTDPVIMSQNRRFGSMDLGSKGIKTFFYNHHCNKYCRSSWTQPKGQAEYFPIRRQTSFERCNGSDDDDDDSNY
eukprot:gene11201-15022_t